MAAVITGTGVAVPPNVVTNDDLIRIMDTTDDWIRSRTGVASRRVGPGSLVAFTSFGAGAHWGAILYREPGGAESA